MTLEPKDGSQMAFSGFSNLTSNVYTLPEAPIQFGPSASPTRPTVPAVCHNSPRFSPTSPAGCIHAAPLRDAQSRNPRSRESAPPSREDGGEEIAAAREGGEVSREGWMESNRHVTVYAESLPQKRGLIRTPCVPLHLSKEHLDV